uniref:Ymf62 n=1 Tax=Tetrahymena rostrata TaxID=5909 RepID=A0A6G5NKI1_TETRO|nr:NADH dehydrogenase subunit 6 [Tetrahymena rostrata]QBI37952.1 Ymf62 [Tetrahymena rostrata]URP31144.1 NADH dehydrogenase subunit 6 [Tetrahymena rostrata]
MFLITFTSIFSNIIVFNNFIISLVDILTPIFFIENFILQFFIIYILYLLVVNNNLYYVLLYVFLEIVFFGLFICLYQLELFTGFLWVAEFTIIFISVVLLFYLNVGGLHLKYNNINNLFYYLPSIVLFLLFYCLDFLSELELYLPIEFNYMDFYDDYYESFNNTNMNDFIPLTLSYYSVNGIEFILIGLLLLLGSVACVNLYKSNKNFSIIKQSNLLNMFNFFKDFINFSFLRKQDLNYQTNFKPSLRSIKKK